MNVNEEIEAHWAEHGDTVLFKSIDSVASYDMVRGNLTRYAYGFLKDWMDAEDAVQEAYVHILTYPPKGEGHNFGGLFKITLDRAIATIRNKNQNKQNVVVEEDSIEDGLSLEETAVSEDLSPEQTLDIVGQTDLIMDLSDNLKPKAKGIVRLAFLFGYSYKEIEGIMKVNTKTIDNTLTYFRQKIRENPRYEDLRR